MTGHSETSGRIYTFDGESYCKLCTPDERVELVRACIDKLAEVEDLA